MEKRHKFSSMAFFLYIYVLLWSFLEIRQKRAADICLTKSDVQMRPEKYALSKASGNNYKFGFPQKLSRMIKAAGRVIWVGSRL